MKLHSLEGYIQNIFIAEYEHGCLLLDGACKADFALILNFFAQELRRPISDLKVIIVTHMHPDHAGCAAALKKRSGAIIVAAEFTRQWYHGISGFLSHTVDICLAYWVARRLKKPFKNLWYSGRLYPDVTLKDAEHVPLFSDWKVITTPGHTDRDISLVNQQQRVIYIADLVVRVKGDYSNPFPIHLPNEYKNSIQRIAQYCGYTLLMAHVPSDILNAEMISALQNKSPQTAQTISGYLRAKLARLKQLAPMSKQT